MLDRLAAFGKPSKRYLFSDHSCFCPGKKRVHMGNQGQLHKCQTMATVGTGASLHGRSLSHHWETTSSLSRDKTHFCTTLITEAARRGSKFSNLFFFALWTCNKNVENYGTLLKWLLKFFIISLISCMRCNFQPIWELHMCFEYIFGTMLELQI